jgi:TetR/AcrR family transcriptional regulator, cholesterol catabolism regulator
LPKSKRVARKVEDRFLDAAARLFRAKGFEATTVREIAKAARMLPGSLHYRYPTKDSLLLALMKRGEDADLVGIRAAIRDERDPVERLRLALRARLRYLLSRPASQVVLFEWRSLEGTAREEMIRLRDRYEAFWSGLLYAAAGTGRLHPGIDLRLLRFLLFGAINGVALWYHADGPRTPDEISDAFWGFIAYGVVDKAHRPDDIGSALRTLSALERGTGEAEERPQ